MRAMGFAIISLLHARRLRRQSRDPPPTRRRWNARERIFQSFLTVRSSLPQSLLGQEVVITLGDASTRQGTVCDVDRQGTVALSKVRRSSARAPTAPLVRDETPRLRRKRPGCNPKNRRFAPPFSLISSRETVLLFRRVREGSRTLRKITHPSPLPLASPYFRTDSRDRR